MVSEAAQNLILPCIAVDETGFSDEAAAILSACVAREAETQRQAKAARSNFTAWLSSNVALCIARDQAGRRYEDDPSEANHRAYQAAWQRLRETTAQTERLEAIRARALAAHRAAWQALERISQLRAAGRAVAALGYDPKDLL